MRPGSSVTSKPSQGDVEFEIDAVDDTLDVELDGEQEDYIALLFGLKGECDLSLDVTVSASIAYRPDIVAWTENYLLQAKADLSLPRRDRYMPSAAGGLVLWGDSGFKAGEPMGQKRPLCRLPSATVGIGHD